MQTSTDSTTDKIKAELSALDAEIVDIDGEKMKPSQCYHFESVPLHVLFNTNCPDSLREKIKTIISKYIPSYETGQ